MLFPSISVMRSLKNLDMRIGKENILPCLKGLYWSIQTNWLSTKEKQKPSVTRYRDFAKHESAPQVQTKCLIQG